MIEDNTSARVVAPALHRQIVQSHSAVCVARHWQVHGQCLAKGLYQVKCKPSRTKPASEVDCVVCGMQVWKMKGWPHQISDGIFVQLESLKPLRSCWFISTDSKQPQQTSNDYKILEPVFR